MRFKRWPRVEAYMETARTRAAVALSQRRQREKLPLLADLIAAEQPSIDAVIGERHRNWPKWQQQKRDQRAELWREARRRLTAYPLITRHAIRRLWDVAPYPGDPSYLGDFLLQIERGRVDPFCRAPWRPSDEEIAEGRTRLAIFSLKFSNRWQRQKLARAHRQQASALQKSVPSGSSRPVTETEFPAF